METSDIQVKLNIHILIENMAHKVMVEEGVAVVEEQDLVVELINNRDQNHGYPCQNRPGPDGRLTKCIVCESIFHHAKDCPDNKKLTFQEHSVQYFTKKIEQCFLRQVVSETLNCALIDTGCSATVCGKNWL